MQDGAWDEVISAANSSAEPDSLLLQSAGYASYQTGDRTAAAGFYNRLLAMDSNNRQALYYSALCSKPTSVILKQSRCWSGFAVTFPTVAQYHVLLADCYEDRRTTLAQLRMASSCRLHRRLSAIS